MKIINYTNNAVISENLTIADTYFKRLKGLLGKKFLKDESILIKPCRWIHSYGMFFEFDAVFLDKDLNVVYLISNFKKNRVSPLIWKAKNVLELPAGNIQQNNIKIGDKLEIIP